MNNPKTRDDDQRSSIANTGPQDAAEKEARRVVEGGQADRRSQQKQQSETSQKEGPAAYAPLTDELSSEDEAREQREKQGAR